MKGAGPIATGWMLLGGAKLLLVGPPMTPPDGPMTTALALLIGWLTTAGGDKDTEAPPANTSAFNFSKSVSDKNGFSGLTLL